MLLAEKVALGDVCTFRACSAQDAHELPILVGLVALWWCVCRAHPQAVIRIVNHSSVGRTFSSRSWLLWLPLRRLRPWRRTQIPASSWVQPFECFFEAAYSGQRVFRVLLKVFRHRKTAGLVRVQNEHQLLAPAHFLRRRPHLCVALVNPEDVVYRFHFVFQAVEPLNLSLECLERPLLGGGGEHKLGLVTLVPFCWYSLR